METTDRPIDPEHLRRQGIRALEQGDLSRAQAYLKQLVLLAPRDAEAWWWLGQSLTNSAMREDCFRRVLALNPSHEGARAMLVGMGSSLSQPVKDAGQESREEAGPPTPPAVGSAQSRARSLAKGARLPSRSKLTLGVVLGVCAGALLLAMLELSGTLDATARALLPYLLRPSPGAENLVPAIELPVTWTPTATFTLSPATATSTQAFPTLTSTLAIEPETYERRLLGANTDITNAEALTRQKKFAEAVLAWDEVLRQVPEYGEGYYQRARVEIDLIGNQRVQSEYRALLEQAYQDIDKAIALTPVLTGDHFYTRFQILDWLAVEEPYFVDRRQIWLLALENLQRSLALGNSFPYSERDLAFLYAALGEWRLGLAEAQRLIRARGPTAPPSCDLNTALAENYQVAGQFTEALTRIDIAIGVCPTHRALGNRVWILYSLGRLAEARAQLDEMIQRNPNYGGGRYYLRALINYDEGRLDDARNDLDFGTGQTWGRAGIYSYLRGRFALLDGDKPGAVELLQYAAATLGPVGTAPFLRRIERELSSLGASPYVVTPQVLIQATLMPTLQPTVTPRPLTGVVAPTPPGTRIVDMTMGTGPLLLRPDDFPSFHFQPSTRLQFDMIESLTIYLISSSPEGIPTLQVSPWSPIEGGIGQIDSPVWGANPVRYPERYVTPGGDFFLQIHNWGDRAIQIDNLGVIMIVRQKDGTRATFGLGEN